MNRRDDAAGRDGANEGKGEKGDKIRNHDKELI